MRHLKNRFFPLCCFLLSFITALLFFPACASSPSQETALPGAATRSTQREADRNGSITEEIRELVETGTPSALTEALNILRIRRLDNTEFGRLMNGLIGTLQRTIYPGLSMPLLPLDIPQNHIYARILRENARGAYTTNPGTDDYFELTLPFLALYNRDASTASLLAAIPDLEKAFNINPDSVIAPFFLAYVYEQTGSLDEAYQWYTRAWELSSDFYPAALGLAALLELQGRIQDNDNFLSDLAFRFPDNQEIKQRLVMAYYRAENWQAAEQAITEILQQDPRNSEFLLMRAHVLVQTGRFLQAQAPLDTYSSINPHSSLYLYLRAQVQSEGFRNREAALVYIRQLARIINDSPANDIDYEATVFAIRFLLESNLQSDQTEGRNLLQKLLENPNPSLTLVTLAMQDALRRESWPEARTYMNRLLSERRSNQDLLNAYTVERGQGNNEAALAFARELYNRDPSFEEGAFAFITSLIDTGRTAEATRIIEPLLNNAAPGTSKSRYHFLRSRTLRNEEARMNELRASLFEDPRNLDSLIAFFEIYHNRRDERRAVYYLRQALALAPDHPLLRRYEAEYAALLESM